MELPKSKPSDDTRKDLAVEKRNVYNKNKNRVVEHLKSKGLRDKAVAAILANIDIETGGSFDFTQKQTKSGDPSDPRTIEYGGYGLFQFDDYSPNQGHRSWYQEYLKDTDKEDSTESQIDYVIGMIYAKDPDSIEYKYKKRMGKGDAEVLQQYLDTTENPRQISDAFVDRFEKAGIPHSDKRRNKTDKYFKELSSKQNINQDKPIADTGEDTPLPKNKSKFPKERVIDLPPEEENKYEDIPFLRYKPVQKLLGLAEGGAVPMKEQMSMFEDGGLMDEGGTVDPVSGNDVPPGSTQEEVRDDIPAQLSEGEFVFPADVVRFIGLGNLMRMRQEAKMGLKMMDEMGQMGNSEEATMPDDLPFDINDLDMEDDDEYNTPQEFAVGGMPTPNPNTGVFYNPAPTAPTTGVAAVPTQAASQQFVQPMRPQQAAVPTAPVYTPAEVPTFKGFVGENIPGVEFEYVEYTNEAGNVIKLRKSKTTGELLDPVPEGYTFVDPEATKTEEVVTTPTTSQTTSVREEGDNAEKRAQKEKEMYGPGGGRLSVGGVTYGVSFNGINPLTGGRSLLGGLIFGGKIPEKLANEITVDIQRGENVVNVNGIEYNQLKDIIKNNERGANSTEAIDFLSEIQQAGYKREAKRIKEKENKIAKETKDKLEEAASMDRDSPERNRIFDDIIKSKVKEAEREERIAESKSTKEYAYDDDDLGSAPTSPRQDSGENRTSSTNFGRDDRGDSSYSGSNSYSGGFNDGPGGAKGMLVNRKKLKAIKKMKRGGLASKK